MSEQASYRDPAEVVRQYGDPVLRQRARAIRKINAGVRELAARMADTMYSVNGVGLAAPQIGESRRIVVIDLGDGLLTLINPRIVSGSGSVTEIEACLSVVGLCGEVERYERVRVKAMDLEGKQLTVDGEGLLARALQHEIDHLDGVLYTDRALSVESTAAGEDEDEGRLSDQAGTEDQSPVTDEQCDPPLQGGDGESIDCGPV